jgi:hypothetical protein
VVHTRHGRGALGLAVLLEEGAEHELVELADSMLSKQIFIRSARQQFVLSKLFDTRAQHCTCVMVWLGRSRGGGGVYAPDTARYIRVMAEVHSLLGTGSCCWLAFL